MALNLYVIDGGRYRDRILEHPACVAYWPLDEGEGITTLRSLVDGIDHVEWTTYYLATANGGRHVTDSPLGYEHGLATELSSGESGAIPNDVQLFATNMTWSAFVRVSSSLGQPNLWQVLGTSPGVFGGGGLLLDASNNLVWRCRSSTPANFDTTIAPGNYPLDEWFFLTVVRSTDSSGTVTMYIDGVQKAQATGRTLSIPSTSSYLGTMLSGFTAGPLGAAHALAHVSIVHAALTPAEVGELVASTDMESFLVNPYLDANSLRIVDSIDARSTCDFTLQVRSDLVDPYRPLEGAEVVVIDTAATPGDERVFGGFIDVVEEDAEAAFDGNGSEELLSLACSCVDYTEFVDRHIVVGDWDAVVSGQVVRDLLETYLIDDGVTAPAGYIEDGPNVSRIVAGYIPLGQVLDDVSTRTGMAWFIDYYRRLRWFAAGTEAAPFDVLLPDRWPSMVAGLDPIAWYRLAPGNALVDETGNHDGTSSVAWGTNPGALSATDDDGACGILGGSSHLFAPYAAALNPTGDFTVMGWMKPSTIAAGTRTLVSLEDTTGRSYVIRQNAAAIEAFVGGTSGLNQVDAPGALTAGAWTFVALTWDGVTIRLFVNGELVDSSAPTSRTLAGTARPLRLAAGGTGSSPSNYWQGSIDEVALLDGAVDADTLARLYATKSAPAGSTNIHRIRRRRARSQYRNVQYVKGGTDTTDLRTESFKGDGSARTYVVAYPVKAVPTAPTVTVNGSAKTVGVKGVDVDREWYYTDGTTEIAQDDGDAPLTSSDVVAITYRGTYPVTVAAQLDDEIATRASREGSSGLYEHVDSSPDVDRSDMAMERAEGLLRRFGTVRNEGTVFTSSTIEPEAANLRAGMTQQVDVGRRGLVGEMLVDQVTITSGEGGVVLYEYTIVSEESTGSWADFFRRLAQRASAEAPAEGETFVLLRNAADIVFVSETFDAPVSAAYAAAIVGTAIVGYSEVGA